MDGLEKQQDGETSVVTQETSEVIKAAENKARSDALADANRSLAEAKMHRTAGEAAEKRVTQMLKDYEEDIRDDPDKLTAFRARLAKATADAELARTVQELDGANERLRQIDEEKAQFTREQRSREIATRLGVDPKKLIKLAKFTDGTSEAIEDIAKDLVNPSESLNPDSNRATGGNQSEKQIREAYRNNPDNSTAKADYLAWRRSKGI